MMAKTDNVAEAKLFKSLLGKISITAHELDQVYCHEQGIERDADAYAMKVIEECGEMLQAWLTVTNRRQSDGRDICVIKNDLENQATDVIMLVLMFAHSANLDLSSAFSRKWIVHYADAESQ